MTPTVYHFGEAPPTREKCFQVSFHEAGHATAATMLGLTVTWAAFVEFFPRPDRIGRGMVGLTRPRSRDECRRRAVVALAGPLAELRHFAEQGVRIAGVEDLPSYAADSAAAAEFVRRAEPDVYRRAALLERCLAEARELVDDDENWESCRRVARGIRRRGVLGGGAVAGAVWGECW